MLILNADDMCRALPMSDTIEVMKQAFSSLSANQAVVPNRAHLPVECHEGTVLVMPAFLQSSDSEALAVKVSSIFERNAEFEQPRIQAAVNVLDPRTGRPIALLEGTVLTAIRTGAASGAATDLMARKVCRQLAVIGSGVQARTHIEAVCSVRSIEQIWVVARSVENGEQLKEELAGQGPIPTDIRITTSAREAVAEADIICTTTSSSEPVINDADIPLGVHINAIGSYSPETSEVPAETVVRSRVVVDQREAAWVEAGDLIQPLNAGLIEEDHIRAELGDVVLGKCLGRETDNEVTLFKSVGIAVQDAAAASLALQNAEKFGLGQKVDW